MDVPRRVRLREFFRRLREAPEASTYEEALMQIGNILTSVEDAMTEIPNNPASWQNDGRLYPPQLDSVRAVDGHARVRRLRSRAHNTYIGNNGSIEISAIDGSPPFQKPGSDGRGVWELN